MITHIIDPNSDKCIVFIHGLGGGTSTFKKFCIYLNKKWNLDYGFRLLYFTFYKSFLNIKGNCIISLIILKALEIILFLFKALWSKENKHNALLLQTYINTNCLNYNNIILVAHSMGGLIARQYIINCKKENVDIRKIRMLITFATPHNGSHIASFISFFSNIPILRNLYTKISKKLNYRISPQIGDLSNLNEFIKQLNKDWRDFGIEKDLRFVRIGGTKDWLVKLNSSNLHNDDVNNVFYYDYTHSGLISPSKNNENFGPIDKFIEKLSLMEFREEYFEELETEINYDEDSSFENY